MMCSDTLCLPLFVDVVHAEDGSRVGCGILRRFPRGNRNRNRKLAVAEKEKKADNGDIASA